MNRNFTFVRAESDGAILTVTINRPGRSNALHSEAHFELHDIFDAFEADPSLRVAIITGEGDRSFCAGNDLKVQAKDGEMLRPSSGFGGITLRQKRTKPIIAAVNGVALGGGFEIVLACDLAVAAPNAWFGFPEVSRGLVPLFGMHSLPRQVPMKLAMAILLSGKNLSAAEAVSYGVVNEISSDLSPREAATSMAGRLLRGSPVAIRTCMQIVEESRHVPDIQQALRIPYTGLNILRASADYKEGPRAFAEHRPPHWEGISLQPD